MQRAWSTWTSSLLEPLPHIEKESKK